MRESEGSKQSKQYTYLSGIKGLARPAGEAPIWEQLLFAGRPWVQRFIH